MCISALIDCTKLAIVDIILMQMQKFFCRYSHSDLTAKVLYYMILNSSIICISMVPVVIIACFDHAAYACV